MFRQEDNIVTPEDDIVIWRYMDFSNFIDIISTSELYFSSIKRLNDPFEGTYTKINKDLLNKQLRGEITKTPGLDFIDTEHHKLENIRDTFLFLRKSFAVNCWNISEHESAALWKMYCSGLDGIAIQSTVGRLKEALKTESRDIYIGKVKYINYLVDMIPFSGITTPIYYKRKSFQYENELRLSTLMPISSKIAETTNHLITKSQEGCRIKIDVNQLITKVYISPTCGKWLKKLVESVTCKYGLIKNIHQSDLNKNPIL
ncbi:MAG: hypothetical protein PHR56_01075 [Dehalococcoidales bacterium]|nr:hypothetical protein [Dehalococcoidales bacterium]